MQKELWEREIEKEKRDRDFWTIMFGGEVAQEDPYFESLDIPVDRMLPESDDELISRSMLSRR